VRSGVDLNQSEHDKSQTISVTALQLKKSDQALVMQPEKKKRTRPVTANIKPS
jgi:hypothetical protein